MPLVFNCVFGVVVYMHSMSVKAAIVEELKEYVPRSEMNIREKAHADWSAEAVKRIDGKLDDALKRLERIENRPRPNFDR